MKNEKIGLKLFNKANFKRSKKFYDDNPVFCSLLLRFEIRQLFCLKEINKKIYLLTIEDDG